MPPAFDGRIIEGYDQDLDGRATPIISRVSVTRLADGRVVCLAGIGPRYTGGGTELYPALFVSENGQPNSWQHLGPPAGEPADWLAARRASGKRIRCEGGTIVQLADGRLRAWLHGYGVRLAVAEADQVEGPWTFIRAADGSLLDALDGVPGGFVFPYVNQLGDRWVISGADAWPPRAILGAISDDGLSFTPLSQPLITPNEILPGSDAIKTLRWTTSADGRLHATASVWSADAGTWVVHTAQASLP